MVYLLHETSRYARISLFQVTGRQSSEETVEKVHLRVDLIKQLEKQFAKQTAPRIDICTMSGIQYWDFSLSSLYQYLQPCLYRLYQGLSFFLQVRIDPSLPELFSKFIYRREIVKTRSCVYFSARICSVILYRVIQTNHIKCIVIKQVKLDSSFQV